MESIRIGDFPTTTTTTTTVAAAVASATATSNKNDCPPPPSPAALLSLETAVETLLHSAAYVQDDLTREYHQALELVPTLVRNESRVADFLRVCGYDAEAAAQRLARYWKTRHWLFGDRWLLPLSQSGSGLLGPREVQILHSGYIQIVKQRHPQNNETTTTTTLVTDFTLLPPHCRRLQPQVIFYLFSVCACANMTLLFVVRSGLRPEMVMTQQVKSTLLTCTATKVTQFYICQAVEYGKEHLLDYYGFQDRILTEQTFHLPCAAHVARRSVKDTLNELHTLGFDRQNIPVALGGQLHRGHFEQWVRMRLSVEDMVMGATIRTAPAIAEAAAATAATSLSLLLNQGGGGSTTMTANSSPLVVAAATMTQDNDNDDNKNKNSTIAKRPQRQREMLHIVRRSNETEREFTKRKNALYVRRNYHRQKLEIKATQEQVAQQRRIHQELMAENIRLQSLRNQAQGMVQRACLGGNYDGKNE